MELPAAGGARTEAGQRAQRADPAADPGGCDGDDGPWPGAGANRVLCCGSADGDEPDRAAAPGGGIQGAYGYRYWTISVADLAGVTTRCGDAGYQVVVAPREIRPGVSISIVADPDGNWVEFLQLTSA